MAWQVFHESKRCSALVEKRVGWPEILLKL